MAQADEITNDEASRILDELVRRATAAGVAAERAQYELEEGQYDDPGFVRLDIANGRKQRRLTAGPSRAARLLSVDFEKVSFLGDYEAIIDYKTGVIEAMISSTTGILRTEFWELPGAEILDETTTESDEASDEADFAPEPFRRPEQWRLLVSSGTTEVEISPWTEMGRALWPPRGSRASLKLRGFGVNTHDEALAALERYGNALLFDFDILYGHALQLQRRRSMSRRVRQDRATLPLKFPRNSYPRQPLALYQYGRTATGLPLLEYLAYYQSLEFFFPIFAREQTVNSLRTALLNPAFDPTSDAEVNRLINLSAPAVRAGMGEREQLRSTVRACVVDDELRAFIESSEFYSEHFCAKKQAIRGVSPLRLQPEQSDLREQVADRIYAIRCRVVHTKSDGGGPGDDPLLPSSEEADSLRADVDLVRFVAQRALFARAARA